VHRNARAVGLEGWWCRGRWTRGGGGGVGMWPELLPLSTTGTETTGLPACVQSSPSLVAVVSLLFRFALPLASLLLYYCLGPHSTPSPPTITDKD
jgi:hypothetical protein